MKNPEKLKKNCLQRQKSSNKLFAGTRRSGNASFLCKVSCALSPSPCEVLTFKTVRSNLDFVKFSPFF